MNRHIVLIGLASAAVTWPMTLFAQNKVLWYNQSDNLIVPSGGGTAALLDQSDIFTAPMTLQPGGHAKGLSIMKNFPTNSPPWEPALQIEDAPNSPDTSGYLLQVLANNTPPKGRPVFRITREGGIQVWDWFAIAPTPNGAYDWLKSRTQAMCFVGSDLADPKIATTMLLSNAGGHHDLLRMHDVVYSLDVNNPGSVRRFTFTGPGSLIFGDKTTSVPALKPQGGVLAVRNGADSDYGDIVTRKAGIGTGTTPPNSTLQVNGSVAEAITTVTSSYNLSDRDAAVLCDASSGSLTITLPSAAGLAGREYKVKRIDGSSHSVTLSTSDGTTIDGASAYSLVSQYAVIILISDGKSWWLF